jgi:hypothetical protein
MGVSSRGAYHGRVRRFTLASSLGWSVADCSFAEVAQGAGKTDVERSSCASTESKLRCRSLGDLECAHRIPLQSATQFCHAQGLLFKHGKSADDTSSTVAQASLRAIAYDEGS